MSAQLPSPSANELPRLPPDILLMVIDCLTQPSSSLPIAYRPSHAVTRTLLAWCRVSRVTYPTALCALYSHCLYIDSSDRLRLLLQSLQQLSTRASGQLNTRNHLPPVNIDRNLHSLFLDLPYQAIASYSVAENVYALFSRISPYLHRLVIDMPLRRFCMEDDGPNTQPRLWEAFIQLVALEYFCSVRDELFMPRNGVENTPDELPVWSFWPKLKVLALYNQDVGSRFFPFLASMKEIRTVVLMRPDRLDEVDIKSMWTNHRENITNQLNITLVDVWSRFPDPPPENLESRDGVIFKRHHVDTSYYGDEDEIELCQEHIKTVALRGELDTLTGVGNVLGR